MRSLLPAHASRRKFLIGGVAATAAASLSFSAGAAPPPLVAANALSRRRGFNLLEKFTLAGDQPFLEWDFDFIAAFGFDYVRLPMDYRIWTIPGGGWREDKLVEIDRAIVLGRERGIHVTLCLHRAPGYCVGKPAEPLDLWGEGDGSEEARRQFAEQWRMFAQRYRGIPSQWLSFNLVNEPNQVDEASYLKVATAAVTAIRAEDAGRLIIADGRHFGRQPTPALLSLGIAQATRGYDPFRLTHYRAPWVDGSDTWPEPAWPMPDEGRSVDRDVLWQDNFAPWQALERAGSGVMVGEWGAFNRTPHAVTLAWMKDNLAIWKKAGWGWALWNLRGTFGVLDSQRADVSYVDHHGTRIDAAMLDLLRQF